MKNRLVFYLIISFLLTGCSNKPNSNNNSESIIIPSANSEIDNFIVSSYEEIKQSEHTVSTAEEIEPVAEMPVDGKLVRILDYIPDAVIDLKYATTDNFTGVVLYDDPEAYLCYGTVKKLINVQNELKDAGYSILIWDAYRSPEAQKKLWDVYPDPNYVADPRNGLTSHSKGNTLDISIVRLDGEKIELPSSFDEFTYAADRNYSDVSEEAAFNATFLEEIMYKNGFTGYHGEWWDYTDTNEYVLEQAETINVKKDDEALVSFLNDNDYTLSDISESNQLITVKSNNSNCDVCCYEKQDNLWCFMNNFNGVIGKNGSTEAKYEGDGCTPKGIYGLGFAFGFEKIETNLEYRIINNNCYWIDDVNSELYNQWIESETVQWNSAEHLIDYYDAYYYGVVIQYNTNPVIKNKGSAIFLHCISGGYTTGCVALPRNNMEYILKWLDSEESPIIIIA